MIHENWNVSNLHVFFGMWFWVIFWLFFRDFNLLSNSTFLIIENYYLGAHKENRKNQLILYSDLSGFHLFNYKSGDLINKSS